MLCKNKPFTARLRRNKIVVQQEAVTRDEFGGTVKTWSNYLTAYASIQNVSASEYFAAKQTQSEQVTRFRIRYSAAADAITTKMRVSFDGRIFDIESAYNEHESNRVIVIVGSETDV